MAWTIDASGTQTVAALGTEYVLDAPLGSLTYDFFVDLSNLQIGDSVELRVYKAAKSGGGLIQTWLGQFSGAQISPGAQAPPIALPYGGKFTLKQTAGTARTFDWEVAHI